MKPLLLTGVFATLGVAMLFAMPGFILPAHAARSVTPSSTIVAPPYTGKSAHSYSHSVGFCGHAKLLHAGSFDFSVGNSTIGVSSTGYGTCYSYFFDGSAVSDAINSVRFPLPTVLGSNSVWANYTYRLGIQLNASSFTPYASCYALGPSTSPSSCDENAGVNLTVTRSVIDLTSHKTLASNTVSTGWILVSNNVSYSSGTWTSTNSTYNGSKFGSSVIKNSSSVALALGSPMLTGHQYQLNLNVSLGAIAWIDSFNSRPIGSYAHARASLFGGNYGLFVTQIVES